MAPKVAVVTGSNKGIGYAIVRGLLKQFDGLVFLTSRNEDLGAKSVSALKGEVGERAKGLLYHQLDITDRATVEKFRDDIKTKYGGIDILVNNAGIAYKAASTAPFGEQAEVTNMTNYFGTKTACDVLFPILNPHSRVVNVSSSAGLLGQVTDQKLRDQFSDPNLTVEQLDSLVNQFISAAKKGIHKEQGFSGSSYGMSKVAETALTFIQQRQMLADSRPDIVVNACCPGYVDTDMTSHKGPLTVDQGAETPIYLALLPSNVDQPKGKFLREKVVRNWLTGEPV